MGGGGALCAEDALGPCDPIHRLTEEGDTEGDENDNQPVSQNGGDVAPDTSQERLSSAGTARVGRGANTGSRGGSWEPAPAWTAPAGRLSGGGSRVEPRSLAHTQTSATKPVGGSCPGVRATARWPGILLRTDIRRARCHVLFTALRGRQGSSFYPRFPWGWSTINQECQIKTRSLLAIILAAFCICLPGLISMTYPNMEGCHGKVFEIHFTAITGRGVGLRGT